MKKAICILIIILLGTSIMFGCSNNNSKNENENYVGEFYTLQEAYDNGILSVEDLHSIAYYHNATETEPAPDYPTQIDISTAQAIKVAYAYKINEIRKEEKIKEQDVLIQKYFGTYHGVVVAFITFASKWTFPALEDKEIAGVFFKNYDINNNVYAFKPKSSV